MVSNSNRPEQFHLRLQQACSDLVTYETAKNQIYAETFPVPTYKVGNRPVIDLAVLNAYFENKRKEGLSKLLS